MKLIDVTNSYPQLVTSQLENTDSHLVRVYTVGKTNVIYSEAPTHNEIVIQNKNRKVKDSEINFVLDKLLPKHQGISKLNHIRTNHLVEISIPVGAAS
ncbi:DUF1827 family protein [Vagococcus elongatus]|uniref:Ribose-5-phosphate isomerase n=1 Tax=Vagococcus elongatus TaxID=180344 RepID=A0A430ARQ0_9ENTE|nr:DUF1827 family protein [Vagococcus elongatus]RSU10730.1 hypothetical protein CBF29_09095 [Vagococcus elongatus]